MARIALNSVRKQLEAQRMKLELALKEVYSIKDPDDLKKIAVTSLQNSIRIIESFQKWLSK